MSKTKICARCGHPKPLKEFSKRNDSPDGLQSYCKRCSKETHTIVSGGVNTNDLTRVKDHALGLLNVDVISVNSGSVGKKASINVDCIFRGIKTNVVITVKGDQ